MVWVNIFLVMSSSFLEIICHFLLLVQPSSYLKQIHIHDFNHFITLGYKSTCLPIFSLFLSYYKASGYKKMFTLFQLLLIFICIQTTVLFECLIFRISPIVNTLSEQVNLYWLQECRKQKNVECRFLRS